MDGAAGYASWAAQCYEARLAPLLRPLPDRGVALAGAWRASCGPGERAATRARLFPGALFLLWIEALAGPRAAAGAEPVAAAVELLHNATLVHDDVIDGHTLRRSQPTLLGGFGLAGAVLGGDGLQADALELLGRAEPAALQRCLPCLGSALRDVALGQWLDEPAQWAAVPPTDRLEHWHRVCRLKLAIGGVGAPLAAWWIGPAARPDAATLAGRLASLADDFAVVSQVINDLGDWFDFAGLHEPSPSGRRRFEESRRKPTLPSLWLAADGIEPSWHGVPDGVQQERLFGRGRTEIAERQARARAAIQGLDLFRPAAATLLDYVDAPRLPLPGLGAGGAR